MSRPTRLASVGTTLAAGLLALASPFALAERAAPARMIKCEGPFARDAGHADLVQAFGADNVLEQEIESVEGEKMKASVLYPGDPKARLEITWVDEQARRGPTIRAKDQSAWAIANGIRIGTALADVEKLNGKPFKLSGFDWDLGGRVLDWQGGALGKPQPGGCLIGIEFVHPEDAPEANLNKVTGDNEFLSDSADMRAVAPYVAAVTISYPRR
jgi:hypothetical protein